MTDLCEDERIFIAHVIKYPDEAMHLAAGMLCERDFAVPLHRKLWLAVSEMMDKGHPISGSQLRRRPELKAHAEQIRELYGSVISVAYLGHHLGELMKTLLRRKLLVISARIEEQINIDADPNSLADEIVSELTGDNRATDRRAAWKSGSDVMIQTVTSIETLVANKGKMLGYETGFALLDRALGGLQPGRVVVVAGRPGSGKSTLAVQMAVGAAEKCGVTAGIYSLEMPEEEVGQRLIADHANIEISKINRGEHVSQQDLVRMSQAAGKLAQGVKFHVRDFPGLSKIQLRVETRKLANKEGAKIFVLDYLQLCETAGKTEDRRLEIGQITKLCKQLAKEFSATFIVACQLSRKADGQDDITLSMLADSDEIGRDADSVIVIHDDQDGDRDISLIKNRGSYLTRIPTKFQGEFYRFRELEYRREEH